ncbi:TetR/AcrR family transcriptional regulator C-terminal domain-containing protein [Pyxidicoccus parkwayensis]|jgi:DNA-binding transcriptional regulator YhcF (GntR family)|uniref:TetR/AcrR family transcriptional regulator C-terminal domain-containing protein n=1 Tax=Pyxidicoccus parkwayensis TaxID=2813578 RepID=A0ABX7NWM6_9BACT|nr:TetR/AcrR family transcriptional regulator C-terminal domain-containing protein [Pyxidicoccus parkwaysis]QSQ23292.1 TetR/AcrR family transcriptional regulator C-terminal domain-containing protein [Pyxidicoccus parkwaysis]
MSRAGDPPYVRIVTELRRRIATGELRAGDRVPSTRQVAKEWGVALATAAKALDALGREGLTQALPRVGTVVTPAAPGVSPASPPQRRRPPVEADTDLSRERIVRAAVAIADSQGLAALSMRSVATRIGVPPMSLYRHVPGKDDLVLLMADAVLRELELPRVPPAGWRARLEVMLRLQWTLYRRHPWLARVLSLSRPQLIPSGMVHTEWALSAVEGLGLDVSAMLHVCLTAVGFVRGIAIELEAESEAEAETGLTNEEWMASQEEPMGRVIHSGRFPMLSRVAAAQDLVVSVDTLFEFGLPRLLDGLAVLLDAPGRRPPTGRGNPHSR